MFVKYNKLLYQITFNLFGIEGIKVLIFYDTRDKDLILNDLFHLFDNASTTDKVNFINKIKNKELNIPIIDDGFINVLNNIEYFRNKVIELVKQNDVSNLKLYFIKHNLLVSYINHDDFDLLIYAIQNNVPVNMIKIITSLYKSLNYNINSKNNENFNMLNNIIEDSIDILMNNNNSILIRLIYLNRILNEYETENDECYYTPLYCAISNNKFSIAKILLKNGANMNFKFNGIDIVYTIVENEKWNELNLKFILQNYSYINSNEFISSISKLIKKNQSIHNFYDLFKIILKYYVKDLDFILKLLSIYKNSIKLSKNQLDNLIMNEYSKIPIEWLIQAIDNNNLDLVMILINYGININRKVENGDSPLFRALKINSIKQYNDDICLDKQNVKIISYLIENNANVNEILNNGESILIYAIKRNNTCIVKDLISYGADVFNQKCKKNEDTILTEAIKTDREEILKYLIEYIRTDNNKDKLLQNPNLINLSIDNSNENITMLLIEGGTQINNNVCLANAIYMDYSNTTIKYLIDHNADVNKKGNCHKTPLYIAIENKNEDLIKYLIDHGANNNINTNTNTNTNTTITIATTITVTTTTTVNNNNNYNNNNNNTDTNNNNSKYYYYYYYYYNYFYYLIFFSFLIKINTSSDNIKIYTKYLVTISND